MMLSQVSIYLYTGDHSMAETRHVVISPVVVSLLFVRCKPVSRVLAAL